MVVTAVAVLVLQTSGVIGLENRIEFRTIRKGYSSGMLVKLTS